MLVKKRTAIARRLRRDMTEDEKRCGGGCVRSSCRTGFADGTRSGGTSSALERLDEISPPDDNWQRRYRHRAEPQITAKFGFRQTAYIATLW
jgi:hypothetical protein